MKCLHAHLAWYLAGGDDPVGRYVAEVLSTEIEGSVAAIDCGTNSTRLLITDVNGTTIERRMTITRLGEGVDSSGVLASSAIDRTMAALRSYREVMDVNGVVRVRAVATSAARDAGNAEEFFAAAEQILGVRPELLDGAEEGRTAYLGATASLDRESGPYLVVDVGGGSTELIAGPTAADGTPAAVISLDIGCVRITERYLFSDPPDAGELEKARRDIEALLSDALAALPALSIPRRLVGVAGTVSTFAHLELGLDAYDGDAAHHFVLSRDRLKVRVSELCSATIAQRRAMRGMEHDRADVIVGGALVLEQVMAKLDQEELICSETDILDGIAAQLR